MHTEIQSIEHIVIICALLVSSFINNILVAFKVSFSVPRM